MSAVLAPLRRWPSQQPLLFLILATLTWFALYQTLLPVSEALVAALPVARESHLGGALQFFFYDTPKVLLLLTGIVFVMGVVHTFISPERTRAMLSGKRLGAGNVMATCGYMHAITVLCWFPRTTISGNLASCGVRRQKLSGFISAMRRRRRWSICFIPERRMSSCSCRIRIRRC